MTQGIGPVNTHKQRTQNLDAGFVRRASLTVDVLLQGKWRVEILCAFRSGPIRLGQLARLIPAASKKMLTQNLRKLEADGIVIRSDLSDTVLHIEYDLDGGAKVAVYALLHNLAKWGDFYLDRSKATLD
jgi:DNA-binding HxlR family transcriptional regulator